MIGLVICFQAISADVKTVKKGDTVPFDGVLFTKELEKSIREDIQVNERKINILTKLNDLNEKEIDILTKRLVVHQKVASEFATREVNSENNAFWKNALYFISGAVITGFIHYGANR
jgi:hypothetical protein